MSRALWPCRLVLGLYLISTPVLTAAPTDAPETPTSEGRHLTLAIGGTEEVSFPLGTDLAISRRGVVDAFHLGDGRWQITALRAGFVVIDARDTASGAARPPRLFIDVLRVGDEVKPAAAPLEPVATIPQWLCQNPEVSCTQDSGLVSGAVRSVAWFLQARSACLANTHCFFAATLTAAARAEWLDTVRLSLGEDYAVTATAAAAGPTLAVIEAYCGKAGRAARAQIVDALTSRSLASGLAWFNCREERGLPRYRLRAEVFLVEAAAADELGFDTLAVVDGALPRLLPSHAQLVAKLKALEQQRKGAMIGGPVLRLAANQPAELASGGEFQVVERALRRGVELDTVDRVEWKQHGLMLKVMATPLNNSRVRLAFDMTFKSRTQGTDQALTLHALKSEVDLILGLPTMAGILDLQTSASDQERLPILSRVPLIGPLFQRAGHQQSKSRLFLWVELTEDNAEGELIAPGPLGKAPEL